MTCLSNLLTFRPLHDCTNTGETIICRMSNLVQVSAKHTPTPFSKPAQATIRCDHLARMRLGKIIDISAQCDASSSKCAIVRTSSADPLWLGHQLHLRNDARSPCGSTVTRKILFHQADFVSNTYSSRQLVCQDIRIASRSRASFVSFPFINKTQKSRENLTRCQDISPT